MASSSSFPAAETQIPQCGSTPPPPPPSSYPGAPPPLTGKPETQLAANINVANFVSTKLSRHSDWSSYNLWKEGMVCLVQSQGLFRFIGSSPPPPSNDSNRLSWKQTDGVVKGWILEALSAELVQYVVHLDSAMRVWQELEAQFSSSKLSGQQEKEWHEQLELYRAAMSGEWDTAEMILKRNPDAIVKRAALTKETALHIAVGSGKSVRFVEELVKISDDATLSIRDALGYNALHIAAWTGNRRAAEILIKRLPDLLYMQCEQTQAFPILLAADNCHRETVELMMQHTRDDLPINPFAGQSGLSLIRALISVGFLDMALDLVNRYPYLARMNSSRHGSALNGIALKDTSFAGHINFWERLLHSCIQLEVKYSHQVQSFHTDRDSQNLKNLHQQQSRCHHRPPSLSSFSAHPSAQPPLPPLHLVPRCCHTTSPSLIFSVSSLSCMSSPSTLLRKSLNAHCHRHHCLSSSSPPQCLPPTVLFSTGCD